LSVAPNELKRIIQPKIFEAKFSMRVAQAAAQHCA